MPDDFTAAVQLLTDDGMNTTAAETIIGNQRDRGEAPSLVDYAQRLIEARHTPNGQAARPNDDKCTARMQMCVCEEPADHEPETAHSCHCGGEWRGTFNTSTFEIVAYPGRPKVDVS